MSATDRKMKMAELRAENANLEQQLFAKDERCVELEARIDLYHGNMYDVVCDQNEKLRAENERLEQRIRELEEAQSTLTKQLRLANEDAERLAEYVGHKRTCTWAVVRSDVKPKCDCKLSDAICLHKERITQESE